MSTTYDGYRAAQLSRFLEWGKPLGYSLPKTQPARGNAMCPGHDTSALLDHHFIASKDGRHVLVGDGYAGPDLDIRRVSAFASYYGLDFVFGSGCWLPPRTRIVVFSVVDPDRARPLFSAPRGQRPLLRVLRNYAPVGWVDPKKQRAADRILQFDATCSIVMARGQGLAALEACWAGFTDRQRALVPADFIARERARNTHFNYEGDPR